MRMISAHSGKLQTLETAGLKNSPTRAFATGLKALDELAPQQSLMRGAVHELLFDQSHGQPKFVAALIARAVGFEARKHEGTEARSEGQGKEGSVLSLLPSSSPLTSCLRASVPSCLLPTIWSDPHHHLYPPALASLGFDLAHTYLLYPNSPADENWAIAECLRCRGIGAVVASPEKISRIEARRFQLAAETGGTVGILLRQKGRGDSIYAAATRWLVAPYPGERMIQRWTIQLLHGHGGRVGQTIFLEWCRETHTVRALEKLADRPAETTTAPPPLRATG